MRIVYNDTCYANYQYHMPAPSLSIYVDLGGTLFDTGRLEADMAAKTKAELGISTLLFEQAARELLAQQNGIYDPQQHAKLLAQMSGKPEAELTAYFTKLFHTEDSAAYVFGDAVQFLKDCTHLGLTHILADGDKSVQQPRFEKSGLATLVDRAIVTQGEKGKVILEDFSAGRLPRGAHVVMVDDSTTHLDNVLETVANSHTILLDRSGENAPETHHTVASLPKAYEYIRSLA